MKKHFTNFIYTLLVVLVGTSGLFAQSEYIWGGPGDKNSEFDGGLNDWTTKAVSPNDSAIWVWEADGKADRGAYSGKENAVQIQSPSVANGAAVFDSDYYDNAGIGGNFGNGPAPSPQVGELISPVFSCENDTTVIVKFNQYYRDFKSTCKLAVSVDGGQTYVKEYEINSELTEAGLATLSNSVAIVDISEVAAKQAEVKIKFVFDGDYYLWIVDDVYVLRDLPAELRIVGTWFSPSQYRMPVSQVTADSFYFVMDVANIGRKSIDTIKAKVSVVNSDLEITYYENEIDNILSSPLKPFDTLKFIQFEHWMPTSDMAPGSYQVQYELIADGTYTDFGKVFRQYFELADNNFVEIIQNDCGGDTIYSNIMSPSDGNYGVSYGGPNDVTSNSFYNLNYFKMSDWANNDKIDIVADSVGFVISDGQFTAPISFTTGIALFRLADTLNNQIITNFNFNDGIILDNNPSEQLTYIGYSTDDVNDCYSFRASKVGIYSEDDEGNTLNYVPLHPNKKYFLAMKWLVAEKIYQGFDSENRGFKRLFYANNSASFVYGSDWSDGGPRYRYYGGGTWDMRVGLRVIHKCGTATKEELLPDNAVMFLGNPTKDNLNVAVSLDKTAEKASMVISDINGRIIDMKTVYNLKDSNERFHVGNLPNGTYTFTLFTKDKFVTKKFVVAK